MDKIQWIKDQHRNTNHLYDGYLPYEFHLNMTVEICRKFSSIFPETLAYSNLYKDCELACYGHDLIEDTRVSYNDVKKVLGENVADIIYAVTNEKGKNRKERANDKYYEGIRNTSGATFVKLCDRIANVQYGKLVGSTMVEMYCKENKSFGEKLGVNQKNSMYYDMFLYLEKLLK